MRITGRHRLAIGATKVVVALVLVSSAVGAASAPVEHANAQASVHVSSGLTLRGTAGDDVLRGGPRNDWIQGGPGHDVLIGGAGNDVIDAVDGERDVIRCGPGYDQVEADRVDVVARDCESVIWHDSGSASN